MPVATARTVLVAASAVTALVPAERIEPVQRTQGLGVPAITLQSISMVPSNHLRGDGGLDANLVQLDVWAANYSEAKEIAGACRAALKAAGFQLQNALDSGHESETDPELSHVIQTWSVFTSS